MKKILIIFGSKSDKNVYEKIEKSLKENKIEYDLQIASAHRTPELVEQILNTADYGVIIAGAGLAAHLPGVIASKTIKPVIGVPCKGNYQGLDALLSIAQMPPGIPVLAVGVDQGEIAAINACKLLKKYSKITIIGDKDEKAVQKALAILDEFKVEYEFSDSINKDNLNIKFTYFKDPVEKKDELVIYVPMLLKDDDNAEASINFLKHTDHGLWVGLNRGENAAIAAVEIMNIDGDFDVNLDQYRDSLKKK